MVSCYLQRSTVCGNSVVDVSCVWKVGVKVRGKLYINYQLDALIIIYS